MCASCEILPARLDSFSKSILCIRDLLVGRCRGIEHTSRPSNYHSTSPRCRISVDIAGEHHPLGGERLTRRATVLLFATLYSHPFPSDSGSRAEVEGR
ncbi:hypothetical protein E2C01_038299 [Portunus trituberculatus]|uniref:Uncharacterized protein n=1 Tax=Portunus trituberculatus TaxID=210409 RepID=A0A5B7FDU2_PORTR|nr:hypothetical protein [Portunus trituberculatus]